MVKTEGLQPSSGGSASHYSHKAYSFPSMRQLLDSKFWYILADVFVMYLDSILSILLELYLHAAKAGLEPTTSVIMPQGLYNGALFTELLGYGGTYRA